MTEKNLRLGRDLIRMLTELEENNALAEVRRLLANGVDPLLIVEWSQEGMRNVGRRYEDGKYFISALIMAGEILYQVLSMVRPIMSERIQVSSHSGRILVGTVQGDIHDIGKNIFAMLLSCHGFEVMDLGVDVPPGDFVTRAFEFRPNVVAMSSLLTTSHISLKECTDLLKAQPGFKELGAKTIIGGGLIDENICSFVGADFWTRDAISGVRFCQKLAGQA